MAAGERSRASYPVLWDLLAACCVAFGAAVVRQRRYRQAGVASTHVTGWRGR